jgi:SHS2 domain-containing protein
MANLERFEFLDHTGDIGLKVWSSTLGGLFTQAAEGLFSVITDFKNISPKKKIDVSLEAVNDLELLVRWLNHLNFLFSAEGILIRQFGKLEIKNYQLKTTVLGEMFNPEKHEIYREIKAVTYHQLILEQQDKNWFAQLIFDL